MRRGRRSVEFSHVNGEPVTSSTTTGIHRRRIIVYGEMGIHVVCDPKYLDAWKAEPYYSRLLAWAREGEASLVHICSGKELFWLNGDGSTSAK
jgi:hypothetical protein